MFVHDYVIVRRPFGELLATLPAVLGSDLASMLHRAWVDVSDSTAVPTVVLGAPRDRIDGVVYPIHWANDAASGTPGLEADLELSPVTGHACDLHLSGRCLVAESTLSPELLRSSRRDAVFAVRSLLTEMKDRLERSPFEHSSLLGRGVR